MMRAAQENAKWTTVDIERNTCAPAIFDIGVFDDGDTLCLNATHRCRLKARCTDSESRFLAINKFSCKPPSRLIAARQSRFFTRNAAADSQGPFVVSTTHRRA
jgi:hypothetical protein